MDQEDLIQKALKNGTEEEEGLIWDTYIIEDSVVQVPREGDEWRIDRVTAIYRILNDEVPLPEIKQVEKQSEAKGVAFERIKGELLREVNDQSSNISEDDDQRKFYLSAIEKTGRALALIHNSGTEIQGYGYFKSEKDSVVAPHDTWRDYIGEKLENLEDIPERFEGAYQTALENFKMERVPENPELSLLHDDYHSGNILVKDDGSVYVIDFDNAIIGDPDFGYINSKYEMCDHDDEEALERFRKGYESVRELDISDEKRDNYVALAILDSIGAGKWLVENRDVDFIDEYSEEVNNWANDYF